MPGVRSIAMKLVTSTNLLYSLCKRSVALFLTCLLFILGNFFKNQNDVEFDFSIGHALVLFPFLLIINKKCKVDHVTIGA